MAPHQRRTLQSNVCSSWLYKKNRIFHWHLKQPRKDFYVDDLMSGANSTTEALDLQAQLIQMLSSAGLVLRKWASNCNELTNLIQEDLRLPNASLSIDDGTVKTLENPTDISIEEIATELEVEKWSVNITEDLREITESFNRSFYQMFAAVGYTRRQNFRLASKAALKDFYVDDLMSGANSTTEALDLQAQLIQVLSSAGLCFEKMGF
ncbi:hypothetical protein CEXT_528801 [Caerostris extrusa]|uniref:Uncharacterized protein n=1 Tax=Caerostris extrusa TaxID=172846 RepID=A0AAV4UTJ8_CAEEX|nr:hypothetical protein CEXT_528801 [Caerostris extrusa]